MKKKTLFKNFLNIDMNTTGKFGVCRLSVIHAVRKKNNFEKDMHCI